MGQMSADVPTKQPQRQVLHTHCLVFQPPHGVPLISQILQVRKCISARLRNLLKSQRQESNPNRVIQEKRALAFAAFFLGRLALPFQLHPGPCKCLPVGLELRKA